MEISISGIKCYKDKKIFRFKRGINLLSGISGSGKSTILESVLWCLYKDSKSTSIYSRNDDTAEVSIIFDLNERIKITRTRAVHNKNIVTVVRGSTTYKDVAAINIITEMFGPRDVFRGTSYICQNGGNVLANGKGSILREKRCTALNNITFSECDIKQQPKFYIDRLRGEKAKIKTSILKTNTAINTLKERLERNYELKYVEEHKNTSPPREEHIAELEKKKKHLRDRLINLENKERQNLVLKSCADELKKQINVLQRKQNGITTSLEGKNSKSMAEAIRALTIDILTIEMETAKNEIEHRISPGINLLCSKLLNHLQRGPFNMRDIDISRKTGLMYEAMLSDLNNVNLTADQVESEKYRLEEANEQDKTMKSRARIMEKIKAFRDDIDDRVIDITTESVVLDKNIIDSEINILINKIECIQRISLLTGSECKSLDVQSEIRNRENNISCLTKINSLIYSFDSDFYYAITSEDKYNFILKERAERKAQTYNVGLHPDIEKQEKCISYLSMISNPDGKTVMQSSHPMSCPSCDVVLSEEDGKLYAVVSEQMRDLEISDLDSARRTLKDMKIVNGLMNSISTITTDYSCDLPEKIFDLSDEMIRLMYNVSGKETKLIKTASHPMYNLDVEKDLLETLERLGEVEDYPGDIIYCYRVQHRDRSIQSSKLMKLLELCKTRDNNEEEIRLLRKQLPDEIIGENLIPNPIRLKLLYKIRIVQAPQYNHVTMKNYNIFVDRMSKLNSIGLGKMSKICRFEHGNDVDQLEKMKTYLETEIISVANNERQYNLICEELISIQIRLKETTEKIIRGLDTKLESCEVLYNKCKALLALMGKSLIFHREYSYILREEEILRVVNVENKVVESLISLCHKVESDMLRQTSFTVNAYLSDVLVMLFPDEPITVTVDMLKQLKTGEIRHEQSISISYRGPKSHNELSDLSGGEEDRIGLALTLAYAQCVNSPFLMLDECFSSLNLDLRARCIDVIKRYCNATIVLVVSHEEEHGIYDNIIEF